MEGFAIILIAMQASIPCPFISDSDSGVTVSLAVGAGVVGRGGVLAIECDSTRSMWLPDDAHL